MTSRPTSRSGLLTACATVAVTTFALAGAGLAAASTATTEPSHDTSHDTSQGSMAPVPSNPAEADPMCDPYQTLVAQFTGEPDPATVMAAVTDLESAIPEDLANQIPVVIAAVNTVLDSNGEDFSAFESPEFAAAQSAANGYVYEHCRFDQRVAVTTEDFHFTGLPAELAAGHTAFLITNEGSESHEFLMLRKNEDVTESWDELLALAPEEAMTKTTSVTAGFVPATGDSTVAIADLTPGDYLVICFIPIGTTMSEQGPSEGSGPPHFTAGMRHEVTVV